MRRGGGATARCRRLPVSTARRSSTPLALPEAADASASSLRSSATSTAALRWSRSRPVYAGDTLTAVTTLTELNLRSGRMGQMLIQSSETVYTNQDGDVVVKTRGTGISY